MTKRAYTNRSEPRFLIECINCFITGGFNVAGTLSVRRFMVDKFSIGVSPQNFAAAMEIQATLSTEYKTKPPVFRFTKQLLEFPIPGAGFEIPRILELGATFAYEVGVEFSFTRAIVIEFGVSTSLPNGALAVADLLDFSNSRTIGFEGATFKPRFQVDSGYGNLEIAGVSKPSVALGVKLVGQLPRLPSSARQPPR